MALYIDFMCEYQSIMTLCSILPIHASLLPLLLWGTKGQKDLCGVQYFFYPLLLLLLLTISSIRDQNFTIKCLIRITYAIVFAWLHNGCSDSFKSMNKLFQLIFCSEDKTLSVKFTR